MQFEIRVGGEVPRRFGSAIADGVQRLADGRAVDVLQRQHAILGVNAGPDAGAGQGMAETGAFLVGPVDEFQRCLGDEPEVVQGAHDLQPRQDAQGTVEFAAGGLAVEVAAEQHRQPVGIAAGPAREHVADGVDAHGQAERLAFGAESVAAAAVDVG